LNLPGTSRVGRVQFFSISALSFSASKPFKPVIRSHLPCGAARLADRADGALLPYSNGSFAVVIHDGRRQRIWRDSLMPFKLDAKLPCVAALVLACMAAGSLQADTRPPAGQMCPEGAYVRGFDASGNIVCSAVTGAVPSKAPETRQGTTLEPVAETGASAAAAHPAKSQPAGEASGGPVISKIKPSGVVFGARETTIRIIGSGFTADSVVTFQGAAYTPTVNTAGTELRVTIETRDLPMGRYAITISNADGTATTKRRALEVF
jgi:hypothetical protein